MSFATCHVHPRTHFVHRSDTNWNLNGPVDSIRDRSSEVEERKKIEAVGELVNGIRAR